MLYLLCACSNTQTDPSNISRSTYNKNYILWQVIIRITFQCSLIQQFCQDTLQYCFDLLARILGPFRGILGPLENDQEGVGVMRQLHAPFLNTNLSSWAQKPCGIAMSTPAPSPVSLSQAQAPRWFMRIASFSASRTI